MLGSLLSHAYRFRAPALAQRHAVVSGSLGVGNLGDDALLAAFLARHGARYDGITVLTSAPASALPGAEFLRDVRGDLPDRLAIMQLPPLGVRGLNVRNLLPRLVSQCACLAHVPGANVDYVLLGGLLGHRGHMRSRVRELRWARGFASRVVYYFGDADFKPEDGDMAAAVLAEVQRGPYFASVRSDEAAQLLRQVSPDVQLQVGTDIVLARYASDNTALPPRRPGKRVALNPSASRIEQTTPIWLGAAQAAIELGLEMDWVSFSDPDDLPLCRSLSAEAARRFGGSHRIVPAAEALTTLAHSASCVATRFHCHIFAYCMGVPVLSVPFGGKTGRLVRALGLTHWELPRTDVSNAAKPLLLGAPQSWPDIKGGLVSLAERHRGVAASFDASLSSA